MIYRTTQKFVNYFSIAMFIFLWSYVPVIAELWTSLLDFAFNICYVVIGALLWPGTLLAILVFGW